MVEFDAKHQANQGEEPCDHAGQDQRSSAPLVDCIDAEDRRDYAWDCRKHDHCTRRTSRKTTLLEQVGGVVADNVASTERVAIVECHTQEEWHVKVLGPENRPKGILLPLVAELCFAVKTL